MKPEFVNGDVRANCPDCGGAVTSFEHRVGGTELGAVVAQLRLEERMVYHLLRCAGCGRGGLATVHTERHVGYANGTLRAFSPLSIDRLATPRDVPPGIQAEFKEAELCASAGAWRAGSSLLRSTLEKTLRANGYEKGSLSDRIDEAATDGTITAARSKRAHEDIRVLGNDVLHDEWRKVTEDEFGQAHHYTQRILEDFYDDRPTVEALLISKGRIKSP
jgi:hypothetical protein